MSPDAQTVDEYLDGVPDGRREAIAAVRAVILANLPEGYEETVQYGMIGYCVPLATYPVTYNGRALAYVGLANQKRYMSLYLMGVYGGRDGDAREFRERFEATGRKLDMGKSCVRFRKLDDLPLDVIGEEVRRVSVDDLIAQYEDARTSSRRKR